MEERRTIPATTRRTSRTPIRERELLLLLVAGIFGVPFAVPRVLSSSFSFVVEAAEDRDRTFVVDDIFLSCV